MISRKFQSILIGSYYLMAFGGMAIAMLAAVVLFVPSLWMTVSYRALFLMASVVMIFIFFRQRGFERIGVWFYVFLAFCVMYGARMIYEGYFNVHEPLRYPSNRYWIFLLGVIMLPAVTFLRPVKITELKMVFRILIYGMAIVVLGATYYYRGVFGTDFGRLARGEFVGESEAFGLNPLILGYLGSTLMVLAIYTFMDRSLLSPRSTIQGVLIFSIGALPFFLGGSRGPVVALIVCSLAVLVSKAQRGEWARVITISILFVLLGTGAIIAAEAVGSSVFNRIMGIGRAIEVGSSSVSRLDSWAYTINRTLSSPLIGDGLERFGNHPHNAIIEAYFATGVFGGSLFVALMIKAWFSAFRLLRSRSYYGWVALLFIHEFTKHMFSSPLWAGSALFYTALGMIAICAHLDRMNFLMKRNQVRSSLVRSVAR